MVEQKQAGKAKQESTYHVLDFYMIRSSLMPLETYTKLIGHGTEEQTKDSLVQLSKDPVIREAIAIGSLSLLSELEHLENEDIKVKKREQILSSLFRYLIRMSTRPTPYGLFSGVACGEWDKQTEMILCSPEEHRAWARPDMEWISKLIQGIEQDTHLVFQLKVKTNPIAYESGSRVKLPFITMDVQDDKVVDQKQGFSIKGSSFLQEIFQLAVEPIPFEALVQKIIERNPHYPEDHVRGFLFQLLKREFLLSELRPPLVDHSPFQHVLDKLSQLQGAESLHQHLSEVKTGVAAYNSEQIGVGESRYVSLVEQMKNIEATKHPLQVDLKLETQCAVLNYAVKHEVEQVADFIGKLSASKSTFPHLKAYRSEFIEKYGMNREVSLLKLLDEDLGLGAPASYQWPKSSKREYTDQAKQNPNDKLLAEWAIQAIANQSYEVHLDEHKLSQLIWEEEKLEKQPPSFDLLFSIHAPSAAAIDQGDFRLVVGATPGSGRAGQVFGRFLHLFEQRVTEKFTEIHEYEKELNPDLLFAEVVYLPFANRNANVVLTKKIRPYEITMGTNYSDSADSHISLQDLVIGCTNDYFYIKSKSLNKEIIPTFSHMLNYMNTPNLYRFLYEISLERDKTMVPFHWGSFEQMPIKPRLRIGKTILAPASWKLNIQTLAAETKESWKKEFACWSKTYKVPQYVYLTQGDNRLLLDLEEPYHLQELYRTLSVSKEVVLTEVGAELTNAWISNSLGQHFHAEFAFPVVQRQVKVISDDEIQVQREQREKEEVTIPVQGKFYDLADTERIYFPGSEWLYVKLYVPYHRENELLESLGCFCQDVEHQRMIRQSFFIRYKDTEHHIRLRFKGEPAVLMSQLLPQLHLWLQQRQEEGLVHKVTIDSYDPEIERYGGLEVMELAEQVFATDSKCVYEWLQLLRSRELDLSPTMLGVINVLHILEAFQLSFELQLKYLNSITVYNKHTEEFRQSRKTYLQLGNSMNNWASLRETESGSILLPLLEERGAAIQAYRKGLIEAQQRSTLVTPIEQIIQSIIHMHMNRLIGIKREEEIKILTLARHTLHHLTYWRKQEQNMVSSTST